MPRVFELEPLSLRDYPVIFAVGSGVLLLLSIPELLLLRRVDGGLAGRRAAAIAILVAVTAWALPFVGGQWRPDIAVVAATLFATTQWANFLVAMYRFFQPGFSLVGLVYLAVSWTVLLFALYIVLRPPLPPMLG